MLKTVNPARLEQQAQSKLAEFLTNVDNRDFLWLDEILEEATKLFSSNSDGEPQLMPKTPSQKNRRKKKRVSSVNNDHFATKRLSKRDSTQTISSKRASRNVRKKNSGVTKDDMENTSPCGRVTRARAIKLSVPSDVPLKKLSICLANDRIPLVEISGNERHSADLELRKTPSQPETVDLTLPVSQESPVKRSQSLSKAALHVVPDTPEAQMREKREVCKLKIANVPCTTGTANEEPTTQENVYVQLQQSSQPSEAILNLNQSPQTPTAPRGARNSVRRSLIGRPSMNSKTSLIEKCSLSFQREKMIRNSIRKSLSKRRISRQVSSAYEHRDETAVDKELAESELKSPPVLHSPVTSKIGKKSLRSHKNSMTSVTKIIKDHQEKDKEEVSSKKRDELQQPQSARRKPSYKRAVNERDDGQHSEDELSPPRKKVPSPQYPSSKAVRPFKTFLHTVHKNQVLMMTPGSVSRNGTIKSFLRQNTPLRTTPQEKERQRLENLKKKEEAEQQRRKKQEEEKKRQLEETKRKREAHIRKVLQARERVVQMEEEKKRRLEQKHAQHEEKNEKVREEKLAEDKVKKKAAAKKLELEIQRKQEEEARKQKALQLVKSWFMGREVLWMSINMFNFCVVLRASLLLLK
uniref:Chromosome passenger complex (CPC) protein INCENP N-terminal domain-containing protein n=1 Tax=Salvator merianae TaxID=96440 RepID=A0A8D0BWY4_SALMN